MGEDMVGKVVTLPKNELGDLAVKLVMSGKIVRVPGNLFIATQRLVPEEVCAKIEETLNIGDIFIIGLVSQGIILANVVIMQQKGDNLEHVDLIEAYIRQAANALLRQKTAERLQESEKLYRSVIENIQDVFYRSDKGGNLIMASPSWAKLLGYDSLDDCIGYNIAEKFYFEPQRRKEFLEEIYRDGSVSDYEVTLKCRDGSPLHVSTHSHLYYDDEGSLLGVEGIFREIHNWHAAAEKTSRPALADAEGSAIGISTVARALSSSKTGEQPTENGVRSPVPVENIRWEMYRSSDCPDVTNPGIKSPDIANQFYLSNALKMAQDYIVILDRSGKCIWANDTMVKAVNAASCDDLSGKSIALYIAPEFRKLALDSLIEIKKGGSKSILLMMLLSSGRVPVETNISPINTEEGELFGYMAIARNVDREKVRKSR
jgi:PAS domain S-box-containing protein